MSGGLERFVAAQAPVYGEALAELKRGRKHGHWMWFVFPQLRGLGMSPTSLFYGISSIDEARDYLRHPLLGARLLECFEAVNRTGERTAERIFGSVDAMKLRSSATLFLMAGGGEPFEQCLDLFFAGAPDPRTIDLLEAGP